MPIYEATKSDSGCGHHVGVLLLTQTNAFIPGDVANASTYDYPVIYRTVPGASSDRVFVGDPELDEAVVETARELESLGVRGISSDCGFFLNYQDVVRRAVRVPVFMSSVLQLPMISAMLGRDRAIGVVTANSNALGNRLLEISGVDAERRIHIKGLQDRPEWDRTVMGQAPYHDSERIEAEVVALGEALVAEDPSIGAIVLECSLLPPYARAVQDATGVPVFDFINLIDYFESGCYRALN